LIEILKLGPTSGNNIDLYHFNKTKKLDTEPMFHLVEK